MIDRNGWIRLDQLQKPEWVTDWLSDWLSEKVTTREAIASKNSHRHGHISVINYGTQPPASVANFFQSSLCQTFIGEDRQQTDESYRTESDFLKIQEQNSSLSNKVVCLFIWKWSMDVLSKKSRRLLLTICSVQKYMSWLSAPVSQ